MSENDERIDMLHAIEIEKEKIQKKYLDSGVEIVSGYNRERELSMDYEGRQIFELLQNADDEAKDSSGKVHITFDSKTLTVSNTGNPFTLSGVKSLLYPNASPKKTSSDKIGCKGLGFRSILTWANCVTVASKGFTIQFSRTNAIDFFRSILDENPDLYEEIESLSHDEYPIATLTCPKIITQDVLEESYATSIIIECREELAQTIEEQIVRLQFEELIFLPHLNEIEISCNQYQKNFLRLSKKIHTLTLSHHCSIINQVCEFQEVITMMDSITVGAKIRMTEAVTGDYPVGSTATILYIDEMENVFIEWSDGKLSSFSDKQVLKGFEKTGA